MKKLWAWLMGDSDREMPSMADFHKSYARDEVLRSAWRAEFDAARTAAIEAVEAPTARYLVWQNNETGWWKVSVWDVTTNPAYYGQFSRADWPLSGDLKEEHKPSMKVMAYGSHRPFEPTFKTRAEAEKWLREKLKPPPEKSFGYDAEGNLVEATA